MRGSIQQVNGNWPNWPALRAHFRRSTKSLKIATGNVFFNEATTNTNSPLAQIKKWNVNFIRMGTEYQELRRKKISDNYIIYWYSPFRVNKQNQWSEWETRTNVQCPLFIHTRAYYCCWCSQVNELQRNIDTNMCISHTVSFPKIINSKRNSCRRERPYFLPSLLFFTLHLCPPKICKLF